ncbi:MAG TPA: sensory rhodopsin transducer [Roseiflexaceae bacterium]|nr:sensory rhodopsin transducer [Roseiflexaceae bacterium]
MAPIGHRTWAISGGHIPPESSGREPEHTSRDVLCLLNTGDADARLRMTLYYEDREPVGPYPLTVPARRLRHVRVNDLIDPEAVPLGVPYGCVIESDAPIVVQLTRVDSGAHAGALVGLPALPS